MEFIDKYVTTQFLYFISKFFIFSINVTNSLLEATKIYYRNANENTSFAITTKFTTSNSMTTIAIVEYNINILLLQHRFATVIR